MAHAGQILIIEIKQQCSACLAALNGWIEDAPKV